MSPETEQTAQDEAPFYVGYQKRMPASLRNFMLPVILLLLLGAALLALAMPSLHDPYGPNRSDFRDIREFEGWLSALPAPHLLMVRPGETGPDAFSRLLLVGRGKSAPRIDVEALDGKRVRVTGSLLYGDGQTLISVRAAEAIAEPEPAVDPVGADDIGGEDEAERAVEAPGGALPGSFAATEPEDLGTHRLRGEIIDSKCHYGTMRPGNTKAHRMCAVRCIAGGVPALFLTLDREGNSLPFLLANQDGKAVFDEVLDYVAEPLEIEGEVERRGDMLILKADPAEYRRL
jgi:hypothetical protein